MDVAGDIAVLIGAIGGSVSALTAARGYREQARALRAETDVRLVRAFADLVPLANARGPVYLSEAAAGRIAEQTFATDQARAQALKAALLTSTVGMQTQVAVLSAIAELGREHEVLRAAARAAVEESPVTGAHRDAALARLG